MNKIPTLFQRDPNNRARVINAINPECQWVLDGEGVATRKYDGTCVMFDGEKWWARREVKQGKLPPNGWVRVTYDAVTGKTMGWEPIEQSAFARYHTEALAVTAEHSWTPGTYELVGPKINGNPEGYGRHLLVEHARAESFSYNPRGYVRLAEWITSAEFSYEGIVWHHEDGRMAKLKRRDFA